MTVARPRYIGALLFALGFYIKLLLPIVSAQWGERREFRDYKAYNKHQLFYNLRKAILTFAKVARRYIIFYQIVDTQNFSLHDAKFNIVPIWIVLPFLRFYIKILKYYEMIDKGEEENGKGIECVDSLSESNLTHSTH